MTNGQGYDLELVLNSIASDQLPVEILCRIAEDSSLPDPVFELLAAHPSWEVREALCDNPSVPVALIQELADDEHPSVRYAVAENHTLPLTILSELCNDENPYVCFRAEKTLARVRNNYVFGSTRHTLVRENFVDKISLSC